MCECVCVGGLVGIYAVNLTIDDTSDIRLDLILESRTWKNLYIFLKEIKMLNFTSLLHWPILNWQQKTDKIQLS